MKNMKKAIWVFVLAAVMLLIPAAVFAEGEAPAVTPGWNADRTQYTLDDGTLAKGLFKAKMKDDVGALFYADDNGNVVKTPGIITVDATKTRFLRTQDAEGHWGFREVGAVDKNTYSYLIGENGEGAIVETAKIYTTSAGRYIVQENGTVMATAGFATVDGVTYYVNSKGVISTVKGWVKANGKKYRVGEGGVVRTKEGAFSVGSERYVIPTGSDGAICTKRSAVKAKSWLYFVRNKEGQLGKNLTYKIGSKKYHVTSKGVVKVGKHKWKDGKYYFSTQKGYLRTTAGLITRDGKRFHVKKGGLVTVNQKFKYKGKNYIAGKDGTIFTGLFTWKGTLYYANERGALNSTAAIITHNGYDYFVAGNGVVTVNKVFSWKGKLYGADEKGHLQDGIFKKGSKYYYADTNHVIRTAEQILQYKGYYYFNKKGGGLARNEWVNYNNKHYYAGDDAAFKTKTFSKSGVTFNPSSTGEISDEEYKKLFPDPAEDEASEEEAAEDAD